MKVKGVIKVKTNIEEINFTTDCSKETFIELTKTIYKKTDLLISSMYFDEYLTNDELKILTSVEVKDLTYVNIQLNKELKLTDVSQQRELLKFFVKTQASELFKTETGFKYNTDCIEETIKNFNCG